MKLRTQYTLGIGGLVCGSLVLLGVTLLTEQLRYGRQIGEVAAENLGESLEYQIEKNGRAMASALAERLVTPLYYSDYRQILGEAAELRSYPDVIAAVVVDTAGVVIGSTPRGDEEPDSRIDRPWVREALTTGRTVGRREKGVLHVAAPAVAGGHVLGAALLELSLEGVLSDIQLEKQRLGGLLRSQSASFSLTGLALGIVLVTLSVMAAAVVADRLSGPVVAFASRARRIGRGELARAAPVKRRDEIGDLARAFDEMAAALRQTTVSKDWFDNVLRSMADMLVVTDEAGRIASANPSCLAALGCDEEALRGVAIDQLLPGFPLGDGEATGRAGESAARFTLARPAGGTLPVRVAAATLRDGSGAPTGRVFVMQDISDRLAAEQRIERSLAEKEILLREIHHRVKNNLQIISSMLSLQGDRTADRQAREVFHESEVRIRAMALVHEQLYRSGDLAHVDLARYLETLVQQVLRYFGRHDCRAEVLVGDDVRDVSVDQAIPIGLIVNELVTNAVQHGFAGSRGGTVRVSLAMAEGERELVVTDDGAGVPAGFDIESGDSLGLKLVLALAGQLGGRFTMSSGDLTRCSVRFPVARAGGDAAAVAAGGSEAA